MRRWLHSLRAVVKRGGARCLRTGSPLTGKIPGRISRGESLFPYRINGYTCSQTMARQFFRTSIQELEALFKERNNSVDVLLALQEELSHRTTECAGRLRTQVGERLANLQLKAPRPKPVPEKSSSGRSPGDQWYPQNRPIHLPSKMCLVLVLGSTSKVVPGTNGAVRKAMKCCACSINQRKRV